MIYNNKIPNISKTLQSTRDTDFISITEIKQFDTLIDEVVSKLSVISNDNSSINSAKDALNIAQEIKKIEFNMADAIKPDGSLNISNTPDPTTGEIGGPVYGEYSMDKMLTRLDELYGQFTKIVGEHKTEWKIDLDNYFNSVYSEFKNTVTSIFQNSVNSEVTEEKLNTKYDYTKRNAVNLEPNQIMRLNPDTAAYSRHINLMISEAQRDYIAFEVEGLESNSLVLHMNFFNGSNYFRFNFIIDKGEAFITKEESFKFNDNEYTIKLWKRTQDTQDIYTVTLAVKNVEANEKYSFELEGLLVGKYDYSMSGFEFINHKSLYNYELVDKNSIKVPDYNTEYYYKEDVPTSDGSESTEFNWKFRTHLRSWDDTEYYIRKQNISEISTINIGSSKDTGTVNIDNTTIDGKDVSTEKSNTVIENKYFNNSLYYTKVDIDSKELFKNKGNVENFVRNNDFYMPDSGIKIVKKGAHTFLKHDKPTYINGKLALGLGSEIVNLVNLKPNRYIKVPFEKSYINDCVTLTSLQNYEEIDSSTTGDKYGLKTMFINSSLDNTYSIEDSRLMSYLINNPNSVDSVNLYNIQNNIYACPQYNSIPEYNDEILKDVSIFRLDTEKHVWKSMTKSDVCPVSYKLCEFTDANRNFTIHATLSTTYFKLFDSINTESRNIILHYNKEKDIFEKFDILNDIFNDVPYINSISKPIFYANKDGLVVIRYTIDNNDTSGLIIGNNSNKDIIVPEKMGKKTYYPGSEYSGKPFISVACNECEHGINKSIACDSDGNLWYSRDGISWKLEDRTKYLFKNVYCDTEGYWFAFNKDGYFMSSPNGYDWTIEPNDFDATDRNNNKFFNLAINRYFLFTDKAAYISETGFDWIKLNVPVGIYRNVAWNTKKFVIVGSTGAYESADGKSINTIALGFTSVATGDWSNVTTYDDDIFVISGKSGIKYSTSNYTSESTLTTFGNPIYARTHFIDDRAINGRLLFNAENSQWGGFVDDQNTVCWGSINYFKDKGRCVGAAYSDSLKIWIAAFATTGLYYSYDGRYWVQTDGVTTTSDLNGNACAWDSTLGLFMSSNGTKFMYSTDGQKWNDASPTTGASINTRMVKFNGYWYVGTKAGVYCTSDGKTWTKTDITSSTVINDITINGNNLLVVAGDAGVYYKTNGGATGFTRSSNVTTSVLSPIYDNNKWYAVTGNKVIKSDDGKTWSDLKTFTTGETINKIASNGTNLVVSGSAGSRVSIDGGTNWTDLSPYRYVWYSKEFNRFYSIGSQNSYWSYNGQNWYKLLENTFTDDLSDAKALSTQAEDPSTYDVLGYHFIYKGRYLYASRNGKWWQKRDLGTEINDISFIGTVGNKDVVLCLKNKGIQLSTTNEFTSNGTYSTYGEKFVPTSITSGNYTISTQTCFSDVNNTGYIVCSENQDNPPVYMNYNKNSIIPITIYEKTKVSFIANFQDTLIAADNTSYLQWNKYDDVFTPSVSVAGRDINFVKSVSYNNNIYGILGLDNSVIFTTKSNNEYRTLSDLSLSDVEIHENEYNDEPVIYGFKTTGGIVKISPDTDTITKTFTDLDSYVIRNMFEKEDGSLIFVGFKDNAYHFFKSTDNRTVTKLDSFTGSIRYCDLVDDNIILLGFENDDNVNQVFYNNKTGKLVRNSLIDNTKIIDFSELTEFKSSYYVFNHLNDNYILSKLNIAENGVITLDTVNYNTESTHIDNEYQKLFIFEGNLYKIGYDTDNTARLFIYDSNNNEFKTLGDSLLTNYIKEHLDGLPVVQTTLDESVKHLNNNDYVSDINNDPYKRDYFYFDEETNGVNLGSYWNTSKIFELKTEMVTAVKSKIGGNINVALALFSDAKIAIYDKKYDSLKTVKFRYVADKTDANVPYYININDSENAYMSAIYSGTKDSENFIYFVIYDKFTTVSHDNYGNFSLSPSDIFSRRLFKVSVNDIINSIDNGDEYVLATWLSDITNPENIKNIELAINQDDIVKTDSIVMNAINDRQYLICGTGLLYPDADSLAYFDLKNSRLEIDTPIIWNTEVEKIVKNTHKQNLELYTDYNEITSTMSSYSSSSSEFPSGSKISTNEYNRPYQIGTNIVDIKKANNKGSLTIYDYDENSNILVSNNLTLESDFTCSKVVNIDDKRGLIIDQANKTPNNCGYILNTADKSIEFDDFSDGTRYFYNDALDTDYGTFRWFNTNKTTFRPKEYPYGSDNRNSGWLYFVPDGTKKVISISIGPNDYVNFAYDSEFGGTFFNIRTHKDYGSETVAYYETYRLINIPTDDENVIDIHDTKYFEQVFTGDDPVIDMQDTSEGLFAITFFTIRTVVYKWNGSDFYEIRVDLNYTEGLKRIFDTSIGVYFIGNKSNWGVYRYDSSTETLIETRYKCYLSGSYDYTDKELYNTIENENGIYLIGLKTNTTDTSIIYNLKTDTSYEVGKYTMSLPNVIKFPKNSKDENFYGLAKLLVEKYGFPLDVSMKAVGNIVYNGRVIPIKGMKIISVDSVNDEPKTVEFNIDEDARIPKSGFNIPDDGNITK